MFSCGSEIGVCSFAEYFKVVFKIDHVRVVFLPLVSFF